MILFFSNSGESLPIAYRLKQEGTKAAVYLHDPRYRKNYRGMVDTVGAGGLKEALRKADLVVFDISRNNERTKQDIALLKIFGLKAGSPSVFGPVADRLRRSVRVIGQSAATEEIELDRKKGSDLAKRIGMKDPETFEFEGFKEGISFLQREKDSLFVFKPCDNQDLDMTYVEKFPGELIEKMTHDYPRRIGSDRLEFILQRVIEGWEISTEGWFDGSEWIHFNHTVEDKRLMNGNLGPAIGSQNNTVWIKRKLGGLLVRNLRNLAPFLKSAGYVGPVDINSIVSSEDGEPYFLEFSPRFGYDAIYCLLTLMKTPLTEFFRDGFKAEFHSGFAASARISIPPYPYHEPRLLDAFARDIPVSGKTENFWMEDVLFEDRIRCAASDGILGVMTGRGETVIEAWKRVYENIGRINVGTYLQYRTDGPRRAERVIEAFKKRGIEYE